MPDNDSRSRCSNNEPFMKLGDGEKAPVLDYNLPQKCSFSVYGKMPKNIPQDWFKESAAAVPPNNWWEQIKDIKRDDLVLNLREWTETGRSQIPLISKSHLFSDTALTKFRTSETTRLRIDAPVLSSSVRNTPRGRTTSEADVNITTVDRTVGLIANSIEMGLKPYVQKSFGGEPNIKWREKPKKTVPTIMIIEEYEVSSYLGDYGAGKTVKTFSLLPGEETTISIKTYSDKETVSVKAKNILDSFSQESADEFEEMISDESGFSESVGSEKTTSGNLGLSLEIPVESVEIGVDAGGGTSNTNSELRTDYESSITSTMDKHVEKSSSFREVDINTSVTETSRSGEEYSTVRNLKNINKSRVLNFVFRQLQQEYVTVTYLKDLKFVFTNGYPESTIVVDIPRVEGLLNEVMEPERVKETLALLFKDYCKVYNYKDKRFSFIEKVIEEYGDCPFAEDGETVEYYRKRKDLSDSYKNISVPGVILNAKSYILRTDSVVADSLLGQGEALDCYNAVLQEEALTTVRLENEKRQLSLNILNEVSGNDKAEAYQKMFNQHNCCCEGKDENAP